MAAPRSAPPSPEPSSPAPAAPSPDTSPSRAWCNGSRFDVADRGGFYESWFSRANHPERPLAFWVRYTVFAPRGRPEEAACERWAIVFDRERGRIVAAKEVVPISDCRLGRDGLDVAMGDATLGEDAMRGAAEHAGHRIAWDLRYTSPQPPILDFPRKLYDGGFPKAKALVGSPGAVWTGRLEVDGESIDVDGWVGSQNHNWGSRHTDRYGWAQVCGFDGEPDSFLECGAGKLRFGPIWTPWLAVIVLRIDGREHRLNGIGRWMRNGGACDGLRLRFDARQGGLRLRGAVEAAPADFVGLPYHDPPGGVRTCLNSKIARAEFTLEEPGREPRRLVSEHRAALEFLVDGGDHGIEVLDLPSPRRP